MWSSNGRSICTIDSQDQAAFAVHTCDVSSGAISSLGTLWSEYNSHIWAVDESFRVMTTAPSGCTLVEIVEISEVGFTLTKIQSFPSRSFINSFINEGSMSFSPITHCISLSGSNELFISYVWSSEDLLHTHGHFSSHCFSSGGSLFAASEGNIVRVWKYDSGHYVGYETFQFQGLYNPLLQLSPAVVG